MCLVVFSRFEEKGRLGKPAILKCKKKVKDKQQQLFRLHFP